jgi:hypothetical protein
MNQLRRMSQSNVNALTHSLSAPVLRDSRDDLLGEHMNITDIQTNSGPPVFMKEIDIHFEGDGLLGIEYENRDGKAVVKGSMDGTVASEYIELIPELIVIGYNRVDCSDMSYRALMIKLVEAWSRSSEITIRFKGTHIVTMGDDSSDSHPSDSIVNEYIYQVLAESECEEYYKGLTELGAKTYADLEFIEYGDLVDIGMPLLKRRRLFKSIQMRINSNIRKCKSDVFPEVTSPRK